jgi:hypothetical protein
MPLISKLVDHEIRLKMHDSVVRSAKIRNIRRKKLSANCDHDQQDCLHNGRGRSAIYWKAVFLLAK